MNKLTIVLLLGGLSLSAAAATPLWLRDVKISPAGDKIAFTYKGDIYSVPSAGGTATRLTATPDAIETFPVWSPDGSRLAFASTRHGSADVFTMNADGSDVRRLTALSSDEIPEAFTPDGREVLFSAAIQDPAASATFPSARLTELYAVPVAGGKYRQVLPTPARYVSYAPNGEYFVYQDVKSPENEWRKHHVSSATRDLWKYEPKSGKHTRLVEHAGEDLNPVVSADGRDLLFLSERNGGSMNVYSMPLAGGEPVALTSFSGHPVRFLSRGANGLTAFAFDGEIYTLAPGAAEPRKLQIDVVDSDYQAPAFHNFSRGNSSAAVSPDGKQIAFVHRGDIFVTSVEYNTTRQLTETPETEAYPTWADGGRTLYYAANPDGRTDLYKLEMTRAEDPDMLHASSLKTSRVFPADPAIERSLPLTNPDASKLAYVQNRNELMVLDLTSKKTTLLAPASLNPERDEGIQFDWSPDGKWLTFTAVAHHHSPYYDIALVNADGNKPEVTFITETGYFDMMPRFTPDGQAVIWVSDRYGMRNHASWGSQNDVMIAYLNRAARDRAKLSEEELALFKKGSKEKKDSVTVVETEGLQERIKRLTPYSSDLSDAIVSPNGETLYYLSAVEQGSDLWKLSLRKGDISVVSKLDLGSGPMLRAHDKDLFIFSSRDMKKMPFSSSKVSNITYGGTQKIDPAAEREKMLEYVRNEVKERFYVADLNGVDFDALIDHYAKFLPHINNNSDFSEMLSEILGELNVSHTGSGYRPARGAEESTASLGLLFDLAYKGPGMKVAEVIAGGPFDRADAIVGPGSIITAIDDTELDGAADLTTLLNGKAGKGVLVATADGRDQIVKPVRLSALNPLLYQRWVRRNAEKVDSLSGGRLGYVHIQSMADPSFRTMYADVLGRYNDRDGIVIDTRWNGGGRMHEDIEILFSGKQYLTQMKRGEKTATMPSRRWNKPSIMIIGEANYSNAHGTPWVYSTMGLGKLVGMPVPGTMTSVNWIDLQDDTMYFGVPVIGYQLPDGSYLENKQLEPDVRVENLPSRIAAGIDDQLETAVKTLLEDIDRTK